MTFFSHGRSRDIATGLSERLYYLLNAFYLKVLEAPDLIISAYTMNDKGVLYAFTPICVRQQFTCANINDEFTFECTLLNWILMRQRLCYVRL